MKSMYDDFEGDAKKKKAPQTPPPKPTASKAGQQDLEKLKADVKVLSQKDDAAEIKTAPAAPPPKAAPAPKGPEPVADTEVYGGPPAKGSKALGVINLLLLLVVIAFQVRIILWQQGINSSVKELEDEVNREKVERVELGNRLLEQIEKIETSPAGGSAQAGVSTQAGASVYTVTTKISLRSKASQKGKKLTTMANGAYVTSLGEQGDWQNVGYGTMTGWCSKKYLSPVSTVKVTSKTLSVRSKASAKGKTVVKLKRGDTAAVLGYAKGWFNIRAKGKKGWVSRKNVKAVK